MLIQDFLLVGPADRSFVLMNAALCRGDLLEALRQLDEEEDVNKALKYFSYEHFYVIYCKVRMCLVPWIIEKTT